jgi:hypothetical protein
MVRFPSPDPFLSVGTYTLGSKAPARGHAVIFDSASSGWIYPTAGYIVGASTYSGNMLQLESPVSVNMDNITLTSEAVGVTMGADAYILDKVYWFNRLKEEKVTQVPRQFMKGSKTNTWHNFVSLIGVRQLNNRILHKPRTVDTSPTRPNHRSQSSVLICLGGYIYGLTGRRLLFKRQRTTIQHI